MNRREMKLLLEERFERIALLETRIDTMEQLVDGYRAREQAIINTLHAAQNTATRVVEEARAEAEAIREQARKEKQSLLEEAKRVFDAATAEAEHEANELRVSAKAETGRVLRDAEIIKREYDELIASFNAMLEQNASELHQTASRFAEFVKGRKIDPPEVRLDGEAFYKSVGAMTEANLPDPSGDPSTLMKNIYRLQNRPMPGVADVAVAEGAAAQNTAEPAAPEEKVKAEPYSEAAWASTKQQSKSEPQAEFTPAFSNAFTPSDFTVRPIECPPEQPAAEQQDKAKAEPYSEAAWASMKQQSSSEPQAEFTPAFSSAFTPSDFTLRPLDCDMPAENAELGAESQSWNEAVNQVERVSPAPYSEPAWAHSAFTSDHEPQAEGAAAFDAMFGNAEPEFSAKPDQAAKPAFASEANSFESVTLSETPAPAPYSESAWAHSAFTSDHEPQAEGSAAFDAVFSEYSQAEKNERSYQSADEPREWEPEREPEMGEIPTVSRFVPQSGLEDDISLDALLDEIIKAGE